MAQELLFVVSETSIQGAKPVSLAEVGLKERKHLQEWVIAHPEILGPDIMILTAEFGRWVRNTGERDRDRLDVLGLDKDGFLVVGELKRGHAPESVLVQGLRYTAMASGFDVDRLTEQYGLYLAKQDPSATPEDARERLEEWLDDTLEDAPLSKPRLVLLAADFEATTTATVAYLRQFDVDIALRVFQPYETPGGEMLLTVSQVLPTPTLEAFAIGPASPGNPSQAKERKREASAVTRIREASALAPNAELKFQPIEQVSEEVRHQVESWIAEVPDRGRAFWDLRRRRRPLRWALDKELYSPTQLALKIMEEAADLTYPSLRGTLFWVDSSGHSLVEIADSIDD